MQVSPEAQQFGDVHPIEETPELLEDVVLVEGAKADLEKLQADLRKAEYRQIFATQLKP